MIRSMGSLGVVTAVAALVLVVRADAQLLKTIGITNRADGPTYAVNVSKVISANPKSSSADDVMSITYSFDFKGRDTVYVKNVGLVPAKGDLSYLLTDRLLEFRESADGPTIVNVPIQTTGYTPPSVRGPELPKESEFPTAVRTGVSARPPAAFQPRAVEVINKHFLAGFFPRENNKIIYNITTYRGLGGLPRNTQGEVAVMVSHPYDPAADRVTFRVQYIVRERRALSGFRSDGIDLTTRTAAEAFIALLIDELKS